MSNSEEWSIYPSYSWRDDNSGSDSDQSSSNGYDTVDRFIVNDSFDSGEDLGEDEGEHFDYELESAHNAFIAELLEELRSASTHSKDDEVALDGNVWSMLPEDELFMILKRLPLAALCRFRCVCSSWKAAISSFGAYQWYTEKNRHPLQPISYLIGVAIFCHAGNESFNLPIYKPLWAPELQTSLQTPHVLRIADVNAGLVCYFHAERYGLRLFVSNPVLGCSQELPFCHSELDACRRFLSKDQSVLKLLVDRKAKTYKVVVVVDDYLLRSSTIPSTMVFTSTTCAWTVFGSYPAIRYSDVYQPRASFCWKDFVHVWDCAKGYRPGTTSMFRFELNSWNEVKVELPCPSWEKFVICSSEDHVLLVQLRKSMVMPISVWKWLGAAEGDSSLPDFSLAKWEAVSVEVDDRVMGVLSDWGFESVEWECICHGSKNISILHRRIDPEFPIRQLEYTFATKTWKAIPISDPSEHPICWEGRSMSPFKFFSWEPDLDHNVKLPTVVANASRCTRSHDEPHDSVAEADT